MENKIICPECKSESIKKDGKRKTDNRGLIQRYKCKECSHRFVFDDGFKRMRNNPQKITCAIDLFYRGVSTRKVQEHFKAFYPHNSSHKSIYKWIVKYSRVISQFTDNLKLNVGKELQIDEMEMGSKKSQFRGWFIDSIDTKTRFMVASEFTKHRDLKEVKNVLGRAKYKTENQFEIITSDGWLAYPTAIQKVWGFSNKTHRVNVFHNQVNASAGEGFNYPIERLHNNIRARTKTFRGFHGKIESANSIMKGYVIFYNFITTHQALNKCPYELATDLKLKNENKWLELIKLSKKQ
jgi:transposase-like protein